MWSGPRNISTAMMRSWENRPDTRVIDEPFYAHFLSHTGLEHPMRDEIIQHGETDWRAVVDHIKHAPDTGIFYQKHITTHWLEHYSTNWLEQLSHVFLIRDPEPVVASYWVKRNVLTASDLGYAQQAALFHLLQQGSAEKPIVIDSKKFLTNPSEQLQLVCKALAIPFYESMLHWPAGSRSSDGVWEAHWYDAVKQSSGFGPPRDSKPELGGEQQRVADSCKPYYEAMRVFAI